MNRQSEFVALVCLAVASTWLAGPSRLGAEEEKQGQVQVEVKVDAEQDGEPGAKTGAVKQRVIEVRVHAHDGLDEKVQEILKGAGLEGDRLQQTVDKVLAACKERCSAGASAIRQIQIPQVMVIGTDGKQQKIELRASGLSFSTDGAAHQELSETLRAKVEAALEKAGLDDKQLEQVRQALDRVGQMRSPRITAFGPPGLRVEAERSPGDDKYIIGLSCAPLNDALRSELKLADGHGLVVVNVFEDTPAEKAGIKEGDVLVKVGGKDVAAIQDLIGAVQSAGKDAKQLEVQLLRDGQEHTIRVAPAGRASLKISVAPQIDEKTLESLKQQLPEAAKRDFFLWRQGPSDIGEIGPGVIAPWGAVKADDAAVADLKKQVEALSRQVKELQSELKKLKADED